MILADPEPGAGATAHGAEGIRAGLLARNERLRASGRLLAMARSVSSSALRRGLAILLLGALGAGPAAALMPAETAACRCSGHSCCGEGAGAKVCPLKRAGLDCCPPAAPGAPGLRSACNCGHDGPPGTVAREMPAVAPRPCRLPDLRLRSARGPVAPPAPFDLARSPEPPPPRPLAVVV